MFSNHHLGPFSALSNDIFYLSVNSRLHLFTIRFGVVDVRESNVAEVGVHAKLGNKMIGEVICFLKIIVGTSSHLIEEK